MNPERAMAVWANALTGPDAAPGGGSIERAVQGWSRATGWSGPLVTGKGVRELLSTVFKALESRKPELWLPEDVYPVYWDLARTSGLSPLPFRTLPAPDWTFLERTAASAVALIPIPLSPLGRLIRSGEVAALTRWLRGGRDRLLLVDAVYTYDFAASRAAFEQLLATNAAVILGSCSKSWLSAQSLGVAATAETRLSSLFARVEAPPLSALGDVTQKLEEHPDLPRRQQEAFRREWSRIEPRLRACEPDWRPPETGYFSAVAQPFEQLLERFDVLGVPASVFGSREPLTIVTCLHDLVQHDKETCPA
jgi:histidinol-phosphate/aromatic aminotransferase/cobyric acid decarboxylase-like protein